jgi:hypothetical protein
MRVQITQNPADESHWTAQIAEEPDEYMVAEDGTVIYKEVFRIPKGENTYLSPIARAANQAAFKDDPAKWQRYVEGKEAAVTLGKKVTNSYNPRIHFSDRIMPVLKGEAMMFWDGWMTPCCILSQYRQVGDTGEARQLVVHDVLYDEGIGTKELLREQVLPMLNTPKWKNKITGWRVIIDPSMASPDQSSSRSSARKEIEKMEIGSPIRCELGPERWEVRRETVNEPFKTLIADGIPAVLLSRSAGRLHRALKGGWHYKTDNNGNIIGNKPVQTDAHSHPGNAWSYGAAILYPYNPVQRMKQHDQDRRQRVASYGGSYYRQKQSGIYIPQREIRVAVLPGKNISRNIG